MPTSAARAGTLVGCLYGLVALASSAVATVLPSIRSEFNTDVATTSWVVTAFVLGLAASTAVFGRVADILGTARPLVVGTVAMAVGAALAAGASNVTMLIIGRALQGLGAGAIPALAGAVVAERFANGERTIALGRVSALAAAAAAGVLVGGLAEQLLSWRAAVAIPVLGLLLMPSTARLGSSHARRGRLDLVGAGLVATLAIGTTLALTTPRYGLTIGAPALVIVAVSGALLRRRVRTDPDSFVSIVDVRNRPLMLTAGTAATMPAAYFGGLILIPTQLHERFDLSPITIGLTLLPAAILGALSSRLIPRLRRSWSAEQVAAFGLELTALGLAVAVAPTGTPFSATVGFAGITVGYALGQSNLLEIGAGSLQPERRATGLGLWNLIFFLGGSIGGAITATLTAPLGAPATGWIIAALPVIATIVLVRSHVDVRRCSGGRVPSQIRRTP